MTYLRDRRCTIPAVLTALAIAVGAFLVIVLSSHAATTSAASSASAPARGATRVAIKSYNYQPKTLTVRVGAKVAWTNDDSVQHSATATGGFDTGLLSRGQTKTITFTKKGTFHYICTIHPFMHGTVVVR